jgi:hypothetical protein
MKLGAEPKKVAILGVLLLAVAVILYFNYRSGDSDSRPAPPPAFQPYQVASVKTAPPAAAPPVRTAESGLSRDDRRRAKQSVSAGEFSFRQGAEPGEEKPDPSTIDPTLRLDLLAKLQQVESPAALRNIFQYGAATPPPSAKPIDLPKGTPKIAVNNTPAPAQPIGPPPPPPAPKAPPITFKYYGYKVSKSDGRKQAFLLDGEEIIIAGENDAMKAGRYKVVRIGLNSITIEDTQFKSEQTLQLQADAVV